MVMTIHSNGTFTIATLNSVDLTIGISQKEFIDLSFRSSSINNVRRLHYTGWSDDLLHSLFPNYFEFSVRVPHINDHGLALHDVVQFGIVKESITEEYFRFVVHEFFLLNHPIHCGVHCCVVHFAKLTNIYIIN